MSLSWREALVVGLVPGGVQVAGRFAAPWREALGALAKSKPRAAFRVVLSNHFLRYDLLPWEGGIAAPAERAVQARVRLRGVHGAAAEDWELRVDEHAHGAAALACAVDQSLLAELAQALGRPPRSCQPYAVAAFNRWRRAVKAAAFRFAVIEPGRIWLGRATRGRWTGALTRRPGEDAAAGTLAMLEQEEALAGAQVPTFAVVSGLDGVGLRRLESAGLRLLQTETELPLCLA